MDEGLEELMAGLFGGLQAPGSEDPRQRRNDFAGGSIGGPSVFIQRLMPYLMGTPGVIRGGRFGPQGGPGQPGPGQPGPNGLVDLLASSLNPIGGPNVAPGNINSGQAVYQPTSPGEGSLGMNPGSMQQPTGAPPRARYTSLPGLNARLGGMQ